MIRVAVCDDSVIQLGLIKSRLDEYATRNGIIFDIVTYEDGDALLEDVEKEGGYDLYILDIVLHGTKGTDIAKSIREKKDPGYIMFYTATESFSDIVNEVKPCLYFVKTATADEFYKMLDQVLK